jgi:type IV pilus assembly protein PilE
MNRMQQRGLTLIELMTVMVIVGILAAIALPSYSQYVRRADRAEAKSALLEDAQFLERNFTVNNTYNIDAVSNDPMVDATLPVGQSPKDSTARYTISLTALGATSFELSAIPVPGGPAADDPCGTLRITNTGLKTATGGTPANCWSR